jgi:glc operon protein GlcG
VNAINALKLSQEGASTALKAALEKAKNMKVSISVAVVDEGGHLLTFTRTDGVRLYTINISIAKARSAALNAESNRQEASCRE